MSSGLWSSILWVIGACAIGFAVSAIFAGGLKLSRRQFLIPYVAIVSIFLYSFTIRNEIDIIAIFTHNWAWGILAGGLMSLYLVRTVRAQPATRQSSGASLALDMAWAGLVYGMLDALFLNIMPVIAVLDRYSSIYLGRDPGRENWDWLHIPDRQPAGDPHLPPGIPRIPG